MAATVVSLGSGLDSSGVEPSIRLRHAKRYLQSAADDLGQVPALLAIRAVFDNWIDAKNVHVDGGGAAHPGAGRGDCAQHDRGFGDAQSRAAVFFRRRDAKPAAVGDRAIEVLGEGAGLVGGRPIVVIEFAAQPLDLRLDLLLVAGHQKIHGWRSLLPEHYSSLATVPEPA